MVWQTRSRILTRLGLGLLAVIFIADVGCHILGESLWFQELGYQDVFLLRLRTRALLWVVVLLCSGGFLAGNFWLVWRLCHLPENPTRGWHYLRPGSMGLSGLLGVLTAVSTVLWVLLYHYGTAGFANWRPAFHHIDLFPPLPPILRFDTLGAIVQTWIKQPAWFSAIGVLVLLLASLPWLTLIVLAIALILIMGLVLVGQWASILAFFQPTAFGTLDRIFDPTDSLSLPLHHDLSFYIFTIPIAKLLQFWSFGLITYGLIAALVLYLLSGKSIESGRFPGFSLAQQHHLYGLGAGLLVTIAGNYLLGCYDQLYSQRGVTYGASYTDVTVQLPINEALAIIALVLAIGCGMHIAISWGYGQQLQHLQVLGPSCPIQDPQDPWHLQSRPSGPPELNSPDVYWHPFQRRSWQQKVLSNRWILGALSFYIIATLTLGQGLPILVQKLIVQPNELARETRYIRRSIAATREAFGLNNIEVRTFDPVGKLTPEDLRANATTIANIRLWDSRPLLQTNRQLQQIRLYYSFPDADLDRYNFITPNPALTNPNAPPSETANSAEVRQVLLAARELDYSAVPPEAQTWVNEHLVYTHGYGFTLSPVNTVGPGGLPDYFVRDIGDAEDGSALFIADESVRETIPIGKPRIYYGALTNTYIMTSTRVQELDYPSGNENLYNVYDGTGGVSLGSLWQRLVYAISLRDWQMLLTRNFTPETKLLFRREVKPRIQAIAPFLRYDSDPYLVIADPRESTELVTTDTDKTAPEPNYLYWIIDAYTTSSLYPYSDPGDLNFNYIRNSVKVVVDAYNGSVDFYIADDQDPLIQTWSKIFPSLFKPLDAMPSALRDHLRYPTELFKVQSERMLTYHMTDPQVFYNREDQWQVPQEIYAGEAQPIQSYYLIMRLPTAENEEFILLNPFTPVSRSNLVAWLAGRSDGENYGKLLLYEFPKQRLIFGPEQVEARINQDPVISQRISLWNRQGSRAVQGNLLVIPLEQSLLYVEPLYLEAERNSLPTLVRVVVVYENRIVMAQNLKKALDILLAEDGTDPDSTVDGNSGTNTGANSGANTGASGANPLGNNLEAGPAGGNPAGGNNLPENPAPEEDSSTDDPTIVRPLEEERPEI
jgi:uncharacterized protein